MMEQHFDDFEVVFVDDGSRDRTREIAESIEDDRLKVHSHSINQNVGAACRTAISLATKDILFWQTVDWSYDLSQLQSFIELLDHYDVVQGVRNPSYRNLRLWRPDHLWRLFRLSGRSDNRRKALVSVINYLIVRVLFRTPLSDFQNITFYRTRWIQSCALQSSSSFVNPEMLIRSHWAGQSMVEVPIPFIPRSVGTAKGTALKSILHSLREIFGHFLRGDVLPPSHLRRRGDLQSWNPKP